MSTPPPLLRLVRGAALAVGIALVVAALIVFATRPTAPAVTAEHWFDVEAERGWRGFIACGLAIAGLLTALAGALLPSALQRPTYTGARPTV